MSTRKHQQAYNIQDCCWQFDPPSTLVYGSKPMTTPVPKTKKYRIRNRVPRELRANKKSNNVHLAKFSKSHTKLIDSEDANEEIIDHIYNMYLTY